MFVLNMFIQCFQIKLNLNFPDWLIGRKKKFDINFSSSVIVGSITCFSNRISACVSLCLFTLHLG